MLPSADKTHKCTINSLFTKVDSISNEQLGHGPLKSSVVSTLNKNRFLSCELKLFSKKSARVTFRSRDVLTIWCCRSLLVPDHLQRPGRCLLVHEGHLEKLVLSSASVPLEDDLAKRKLKKCLTLGNVRSTNCQQRISVDVMLTIYFFGVLPP